MDLLNLVLLAIVQGVTEFLPVSSQAHLILARRLLGMSDQSVLIDLALHFGSVFAVILYFWRDVRDAVLGPFHLVSDLVAGRPLGWPARLCLLLAVATAPRVLGGVFLLSIGAIDAMRSWDGNVALQVIGWTTLGFGVLLYVADRFSPSDREARDWSWGSALAMGLAQTIALVPGVSRAGITMTMARFLGFDRQEGARLALLMAIPAILSQSVKGGLDLWAAGDVSLTLDVALAAGLAFVSAYAALALMMRWLAHATFTPFVVYRIALGGLLLFFAYAAP